jgi:hypothetical protein
LKTTIPDFGDRPAGLQSAAARLPKQISPSLIKSDLDRLPPLAPAVKAEVAKRVDGEFDTFQVLGVAWSMTRRSSADTKALARDVVVRQLDEIGWINFQAEPAGSTLVVDDVPTPPSRNGFFAVDPGKHVLTARKPGYKSAPVTQISSESGGTIHYEPRLDKE